MSDPTRRRTTGPLVPDRDWTADAHCARVDPFVWDAYVEGVGGDAKRICRACPVARPCLEDALSRNEVHGVWGGLTYPERRSLRRRALKDRNAAA